MSDYLPQVLSTRIAMMMVLLQYYVSNTREAVVFLGCDPV